MCGCSCTLAIMPTRKIAARGARQAAHRAGRLLLLLPSLLLLLLQQLSDRQSLPLPSPPLSPLAPLAPLAPLPTSLPLLQPLCCCQS